MVLGIGVPHQGSIRVKTSFCITANLVTCPAEIKLFLKEGCYLHWNREQILSEALASSCSHLWFIDTDMVFPPKTLSQLISLDADIAAARYNMRTYTQILSTTKTMDKGGVLENLWLDSMPKEAFNLAGDPPKRITVPTGMMLIKLDAVRQKMTPPYFTCENGIGEDVFFCKKALQSGLDIWCDPTIEVGHIGEAIY